MYSGSTSNLMRLYSTFNEVLLVRKEIFGAYQMLQ